VRLHMTINNVRFEGMGFARQRQTTEFIVSRRKKFPWVRVLLARKDKWDSDTGQLIAALRALDVVIRNVTRVYERWEKGQVAFPSKEV